MVLTANASAARFAFVILLFAALLTPETADASFDVPPNWYSGDVHVHWPNSCLGVSGPEDVLAAMPPDLNFASVLIWCGGDTFAEDAEAYFTGREDSPVSTPTQVVHYDLEVSECGIADRMGHVNYLYLEDIFFPQATYQGPIMDWARAQGAYVGFDHVQNWVTSFDEFPRVQPCCIPYEAPIGVALEKVDYLTYQPTGSLGWRFLWYTLLDCGFRMGLASSTDAFCIPFEVGSKRTWARVDGPMTYGNYVDALARGRMTTTEDCDNFLHFTVDGVEVGEEIQLTPRATVTVQARVVLPDGEPRSGTIEIVRNREVMASQAYSQTGGEVVLTTDLTIDRSSWLSARTEKSHAGAVFALVNGNPVRPSTESPQYFIDYMDWMTGLVQDDVFDQLTPDDKAALLVDIAAAKSVFQQILSEAQQAVAVDEQPVVSGLVGALPNPFQGSTAISFRSPEASDAKVRIYSSDGRLVRELSSASAQESGGTFIWDGRDGGGRNVASGVYVYRVTVRGSLLGHGKVVRVE